MEPRTLPDAQTRIMWMFQGKATIGALVAGALMLSGGTPAQGQTTARIDAIQDLLDRRARALIEHDKQMFLATVGPKGSEFFDKQSSLFDHLSQLPIASYSLIVEPQRYGDLARPSDRDRYAGAEEVAIPLTTESYRLAGYDNDPVAQDVYYTFVQRDDDWRIESDTDLDDLGFNTQRGPWDFSAVDVSRTEHFVGISGDCSGCPTADTALSVAEEALTIVDRFWSQPWSRRVPVYAPQGFEELSSIIQATYPVDNYVAFAFWTGGEGENPGARIIVNPDRFLGADRDRALSILTHELFHAASLPHSGPFIPRFVEEGLAQYVQYEGSDSVIAGADASSAGELPDDYRFFVGSTDALLQTYRTSLSAIGFLAERWGPSKLERFYVRLGRRGNDPGTTRYQLDSAMRDVLGVSSKKFEALWASSI